MAKLYAVEEIYETQKKIVCVFKTERGDYQYTSCVKGQFSPLRQEDPMDSYPPKEQRDMKLYTAVAYAQTFLEQPIAQNL